MIPLKPTKRPAQQLLKEHWIMGTTLTAFVGELSFILMVLSLMTAVSKNAEATCSGSMSSFGSGFGCALGGIMLTLVAAAVITSGIVVLLLIRLATLRKSLAILGGIHALLVMVTAQAVHVALVEYVPASIASELLRSWVVYVALSVMLAAALVIHLKLCSIALKKHILFAIAVSLILNVFYVSVLPSKTTLISNSEDKTYAEEQLKQTKQLDFKLYQPTYVPSKFKVHSSVTHESNTNRASYQEINYIAGKNYQNDPSPYAITQFALPEIYQPPTSCGRKTPPRKLDLDTKYPCELIGKSSIGCDVYYASSNMHNLVHAYCKLDKTLVVYQTYTGKNNPGKNEIIKIFDSLKPTDAESLMQLNL